MDEKDLRIIDAVIRRSGSTVNMLSKDLGIPKPTAQKRLAALIRKGNLSRQIKVVNWNESGYPLFYRIDIVVDQRELAAGNGGPRKRKSNKVRSPERISDQFALARYIKSELANDPRFRDNVVVESVSVLLGHQADLTLSLRAKSYNAVLDFVTIGLRTLGGIQNTVTSQAGWSC